MPLPNLRVFISSMAASFLRSRFHVEPTKTVDIIHVSLVGVIHKDGGRCLLYQMCTIMIIILFTAKFFSDYRCEECHDDDERIIPGEG